MDKQRAIAAAEEAQLVIAVFDLSRPWDAEDEAVLAIAEKAAVRIAAANKSDCAPRWDVSRLSAHFDSVCVVSAKEKSGLDALGAAVAAAFPMPEADSGEILTNARQADAVRRALEYLRAAREAMAAGFAPDAVLTAPETRSSSPVRILRDVDRRSEIRGLYPCGEGAGYAGGITSAAVDGMKCAESLMSTL